MSRLNLVETNGGSLHMSANGRISACQSLIAEQLPLRYPTIACTARLLGMPVRTLQRRLQRNGLSYSELVERNAFGSGVQPARYARRIRGSGGKGFGIRRSGQFLRCFQALDEHVPQGVPAAKTAENRQIGLMSGFLAIWHEMARFGATLQAQYLLMFAGSP